MGTVTQIRQPDRAAVAVSRPCHRRGVAARRTGLGAVALAGVAVCGLTAGCGRREPVRAEGEDAPPAAPAAEPASPPLARVGTTAITEEDFAFELRRRRETGVPTGDAESVLEDLVRRAAMLQEAERAEWMDEPELRRERDNLRLSQWLDRTLRQEKDRVAVSDDELRAHYEAHVADHTMPALVRIAILHRRDASRDPAASHALADGLREVRRRFLADREGATQKGRIPGFGTLASEASEDAASRYRGGDLGWLDPARDDARWPAAVLKAGFALQTGEVSDVIAAGDGLYVVMKQDERAARVTPFEQVATTIRRRLLREKQEATERAFVDGILARAGVEVNRERAARLVVPSVEPVSDPPMLLPVGEASTGPHGP